MSVKQEQTKKNSMLTGWVKNPLERLHKSSDIDNYCPDAIEFIYGCDTISEGIYTDAYNNRMNSFDHLKDMKKSGSNSNLLMPFMDHFKRENKIYQNSLCSSTPSSKDVSPEVTPQHSPTIPRKTNYETKSRKWFQSTLLNTDHKDYNFIDGSNSKSTFKKFSVSNFDLNVVGPTSW